MRQRNVKNQEEILDSFDRYVAQPESQKGKWKKEFKEVHLEIGIGKGQFITNKALLNPDILFVGIELNKGVMALAVKKLLRFEAEKCVKLNNLMLFSYDAIKLNEVFEKQEVDKIYLNFSDPWPKKKHIKRRLTSDMFLSVYKEVLKKDGVIEQKTDNRGLIEYSICNANKNEMQILDLSLDLYKDIELGVLNDNIPTEYEEKFKQKGPIYRLVIKFGGR